MFKWAFNGVVGGLEKYAFLLGLGGSADTLDIAKAKQEAVNEITIFCDYHQINDQKKQQLVQDAHKEIDEKGFWLEIDKRDFENSIEENEQKDIFGTNSETNSLPKNLQKQNIYYFKSCRQPNGWSCGFFTVYNACAIENILTTNSNILSGSNVENLVAQMYTDDFNDNNSLLKNRYKFKNKSKYLEGYEIYDLAKLKGIGDLNMHNKVFSKFYILGLSGNQGVVYAPYVNTSLVYSQDTNAQIDYNYQLTHAANIKQDIFFNNLKIFQYTGIKNNSRFNLYFGCNVSVLNQDNSPDHWVLIAIVRQKDRQPVMILFDSINKKQANENYCKYIKFLHEKFIEPYQN